MIGTENQGYVSDETVYTISENSTVDSTPRNLDLKDDKTEKTRDSWGKDIQFLFACIALSVGLGEIDETSL
jgi:hypothetical protein